MLGDRRAAVGGRAWSRGSWWWSVVGRSSLVARFDSRSLDARRRSADLGKKGGVIISHFKSISCEILDFRGGGMAIRGLLEIPGDIPVRILERAGVNFVTVQIDFA